MILKIFNLNIEGGRFINNIVDFLKKNDFDVLNFQEISTNCFETIKKALSFQAEEAVCWRLINEPQNYLSNAIFYKKSITLIKKEIIVLRQYKEITPDERKDWAKLPRNALALTFEIKNKRFVDINTHLSWSPNSNDSEEKIKQGKILLDYLQNLSLPFVLSGDFNSNPKTITTSQLEKVARNLTKENNITNTLNPRIHRDKEILFPPGVSCDYIFVDKSTKVKSFKLVDQPDLADHFGLAVEIEI